MSAEPGGPRLAQPQRAPGDAERSNSAQGLQRHSVHRPAARRVDRRIPGAALTFAQRHCPSGGEVARRAMSPTGASGGLSQPVMPWGPVGVTAA